MFEKAFSKEVWASLLEQWPLFAKSFLVTLSLAILGLILALTLGVIFGILSSSKHKVLRGIARVYVEFFQNTPLLIQFIFMYYGLPLVGFTMSWFTIGIIGVGLYHGAYIAEIVRSSVMSVARGQFEAAKSQGFTSLQSMFYIILPQAWRVMLPPLANQAVNLTKNTSTVSIIAGADMMYTARSLSAPSDNYAPAFIIVGALYFLICFPLATITRKMEESNKKAFTR